MAGPLASDSVLVPASLVGGFDETSPDFGDHHSICSTCSSSSGNNKPLALTTTWMPASMSMSMSTIAASEQTWAAGLEALPWEAQTNVPKRLRTLTKAMTELGSKMGRRRDTIYVDAPPSLVNITIVRGTSLREDVRQQRKDELGQKAVRAAGSVLALAAWYVGEGVVNVLCRA